MTRPMLPNAVGYTAKRADGRVVVVHRHIAAENVLAIVPLESAGEIAHMMLLREGLTERVQKLYSALGQAQNFGGCI